MTEKVNQNEDARTDNGTNTLKTALIVFALIEALVTIPLVLYKIFR